MRVSKVDLGDTVRKRMPVLDGWRGIAILVVVLHNSGYVLEPDGSLVATLTRTLLASGWVGVSLFFVLSGFLITGILLDTRDSPTHLRDFYVRRTLRIFPLYYGFLVVALLIVPLLVAEGPWTESVRTNHVWYWLYLSNTPLPNGEILGLPHIWSLAVEEQFYLVWPLLLFLTGPSRFTGAVILVILGSFFSRVAMYAGGADPWYLYSFTPARADCLAIGALMAIVARRAEWLTAFWHVRKWAFFALFAGLAAIVLLSLGFDAEIPLVSVVGQTLIGLAFASLMLSTLGPESRLEHVVHTIVSARWLQRLGKYSYAVYLFHVPLHTLLQGTARPWVNGGGSTERVVLTVSYALFILATSLVMAFASWHLFEKHFLALKERLAPRRTPT